MLLLSVFLMACGRAESPFDRYVEFRKKNPDIRIEFTTNEAPGVKALALIQGRERLRFEAKGPELDFVYSHTPEALVELLRNDRVYDERPGIPGRPLIESRISSAPSFFPAWVYFDDLRKAAPPTAKWQSKGRQKVDGVEGDAMSVEFEAQGGKGEATFHIDAQGKVVRARIYMTGMMGTSDQIWVVNKMEPLKATKAQFELPIPDGFSPYALPHEYGPASIGETVSLTGWQSLDGKSLDLKKRLGPKGGLIAIWGADSEPSQRSSTSLTKLKSGGISVVVLSDSSKPNEVKGAEGFDPTGKARASFRVPATPVFYFVDPAGKIIRVWMGYDPNEAASFEQDVRNAASGK